MKTRLILKPGQPGTKNLEKKYGNALLCVRFRYDEKLRQRLKTVELVVEKTDCPPPQYTADNTLLSFGSQDRKRVEHVGGFVILDVDHSGSFDAMRDTVVYHKTPCAAKEI